MRIPLDRESHIPLYKQIEIFLRESILSGALPPETRLPARRELANDLDVNRMTVEHAYAELEADGLLYSRMGSGTYTLPPPSLLQISPSDTEITWPQWQQDLDSENQGAVSLDPERLLESAGHPDPIAFDAGTGDACLFPVESFRKVLQDVMRNEGPEILNYGDHRGYFALRRTIAQILTSQGLATHHDNVLITSGSQQSIALVTRFLLTPGDIVLVESPTYGRALELFRSLRLIPVAIPMDDDGLQIEPLERLFRQHCARLLYTMPNFHNPTGISLSIQRRIQLVELARRYDVPILEDDFVGDLCYEGRSLPSLKSLDTNGSVIYISTFSKMLMPSLRIGFLLAHGPVYDKLAAFKRVNDLASSNLLQQALDAYISIGRYQAHLHRSRRTYRKRRDSMLRAIKAYLPDTVQFSVPKGGLFFWLKLPEYMSSERLLHTACQCGVSFAPGSLFFTDNEYQNADQFLRLNFALHEPDVIDEEIRRLGRAIAEYG